MKIDQYILKEEPYYHELGNEISSYKAAYKNKIPMMLKGPTGCGKTRFVEHLAWQLKKPLITVSCHEDMTSSDLVGRYLLDKNGTKWHDGPLTTAVRYGGICYLDEIVEARQDTTVIIHSLTDNRRILPLEKKNEVLSAHKDFHLVISYNPGYQSVLKDLKESTKQRFGAIELEYPKKDIEIKIIQNETKINFETASCLVDFAKNSRNLKGSGLDEGLSTRMLIRTAELINNGIKFNEACEIGLIIPLTDDKDIRESLRKIIFTYKL
tara:strand:- start:2544 stop:3344 length:801 start_codon:yes stop_codon:yes gene_type:complete